MARNTPRSGTPPRGAHSTARGPAGTAGGPTGELAAHCAELFAPLGRVRLRRMFGGHGVYLDDIFMAIITGDRCYLKVDDSTRLRFEAAGCEPFAFESSGRPVRLGYFSAPDEAMDSPALMQPWARLALEAALRARAAKPRAAAPANAAKPRSVSAKSRVPKP